MYNMYDLDAAYQSFVQRFGIEPNGLLMSETTYLDVKAYIDKIFVNPVEPKTYRGVPIFRSEQMEAGKMRFII